jgi:hypothetical protein
MQDYPPDYIVAFDLGQTQDCTGIAILEDPIWVEGEWQRHRYGILQRGRGSQPRWRA